MSSNYGSTYQFALPAAGEDVPAVDLRIDPPTGERLGCPTAIEVLGAGEMVFTLDGQDDIPRRYTELTGVESFSDVKIARVIMVPTTFPDEEGPTSTTITGLRVRW